MYNLLYLPKYFYNLISKRSFKKLLKYEASRSPRVALCLFGLVGGVKGCSGDNIATGSEDILRIGYKHCKKRILDKNHCVDVFIHTWSTDLKKEITQLYKPKRSI